LRIAAAIFDMDGLLLDTEPIYRLAWQRAAADFGQVIDDELYFLLVGRSAKDAEAVLAGLFGASFPLVGFRRAWLGHWRAEVDRCGIAHKPGLAAVLAAADEIGLPKLIATSTERHDAEFTLERAGLSGRFQGVVTGDMVARGKPAPDIFLAAAALAGAAPSRCIAFEDSDAGALAAAAAGMLTVIVPDMKPPAAGARAAAYRVLASLDEAPALLRDLTG
jgi:beta-phosphoglucomutase-like phosphatase (HAD superfamily)